MHPVLFSIGNMHIYGYGASIAVGMIIAMIFGYVRAKKHNIDPDMIFTAGFAGIVAGIIGAKIFYWLVELDEIIANPKLLLQLDGGFVFYGGIIFGVLTPFIYIKCIKKQTFLDKIDMAVPAISLAQAFGRLGCFLAGCCYGREAEASWNTVVFPENAYSSAPAGVPLYATQLMSAGGNLLLFVILYFISKKEKFRGEAISFYMLFYSAGRFLLEFLRGDERGSIGIFSTSQFISLFIFAAGLVLLIICANKKWAPFGSRELDQDHPFGEKTAAEEAAEEAADAAEEKAEEAVETVEEKAEEAVETVEEKAEEAVEAVEEKAEETVEAAEEGLKEAADTVKPEE